jgi:peptide/nickel transport system substrate-binding protein
VAVNISSQAAEQLRSNPEIQILESPETAQPTFMAVDNRFPDEPSPLQDVDVRRALLMAIDREAIAATLYRGYATVPVGGLLPVTLGFDDTREPIPFDPDGARALLEEAGASDLSFILHSYSATATVPDIAKLVEAVAGYWQQVGVGVTLNIYDANSYLPEYRAGQLRGFGVLSLPSSSHMEASNFCFYYCSDGPYSTLDDPAVDDLITRISSTVDIDERAALGRELNDLMADELYALPIVLVSSLMAVGPNIESWDLQRGTPYAGPLWYLRAR